MNVLALKIASRYLKQLPKVLLALVALVFVATQSLIILATSLPLDASQRADKVVGTKNYSFTGSGQTLVESLSIAPKIETTLAMKPGSFTESYFGDGYLSGASLHVNFSDDITEFNKSMKNLGLDSQGIDGFLYSEKASKTSTIDTTFVGSISANSLHLIQVTSNYTRLVLKPGTFKHIEWKNDGILPSATLGLNFDSSLSNAELVGKITPLFGKNEFMQAEKPFGCMANYCLMDRNFVISEGRGNYLSNLSTPYLLAILLVLLPILIRASKELRLEANILSELGIKGFRAPKIGTFRLLATLVLLLNLFSFVGLFVGAIAYWIFKSQASTDFGSLLVPVDLIFGGIIWSLLAAAVMAFGGEKRTFTFTSKSLRRSAKTTNLVLIMAFLLGLLQVLGALAVPEILDWMSPPEAKWEVIAAFGVLLLSIASISKKMLSKAQRTSLFKRTIQRKYPLLSFFMIASLMAASLLGGVAAPAIALSYRVGQLQDSSLVPEGTFAMPARADFQNAVASKATLIADYQQLIPRSIIVSSIPEARGGGSILLATASNAKKLWPELQSEPQLKSGALYVFATSIDKIDAKVRDARFVVGETEAITSIQYLKTNDIWGANYIGVLIDKVPANFIDFFDSSKDMVLMRTSFDRETINAVLLDKGIDPAPVYFWRDFPTQQLAYRISLFLAFAFLLGLLMSFFIVRAVNSTFGREAALIKTLGYSNREIRTTVRWMLLKNFLAAFGLSLISILFYFSRSNQGVPGVTNEYALAAIAFVFATVTGLIPILFAGRIRLQVEEDVR